MQLMQNPLVLHAFHAKGQINVLCKTGIKVFKFRTISIIGHL